MVDIKLLPMDRRFNLYKLEHLCWVNFKSVGGFSDIVDFIERCWYRIISVVRVPEVGTRIYFVCKDQDIDNIIGRYRDRLQGIGGTYKLDGDTLRMLEGYGYNFYEWDGRRWVKL